MVDRRRLARASFALVVTVGLAVAARPARAQTIYDPQANARAAIQSALTEAQRDQKLVLLDFGADWCLDCVILDHLLQDAAVQPYLGEHYHLVRVDVGRFDHNLDIVRKYGTPIEGGVPAIVVLAPSGRILVNTRDGSMEGARRMTPAVIRRNLEQWATPQP